MANIFQTTNYPTSFLEGTFGDKYYQSVVEPAKAAIKSGSTASKPPLGQLIKNWNPLKAFTPQMLATGPTAAAKTFLKGSALGAITGILSPTRLGADDMPTGDIEQEYFDYYNQYGDNYGDLKIPGWRKRKMDKLATQKGLAQVAMQKQIQQAQDAGGTGGPQQTLQAQITAQANREARERVARGEAKDYGHTQTRSSSGWRSDPMWKGGIAGLRIKKVPAPYARGGILGAF